jgi:hypothetical protein
MSRLLSAIALVVLLSGAAAAESHCGGPDTVFDWHGFTSAKDASDSESEPLQSDRPGLGDCPSAVGCDRCQLEIGYQYSYDHDDISSHIVQTYPQSLLRVGEFANWFELRVSWSLEQDTDRVFGVSHHTDVGSQDMNVGFKIALTSQDGWLPKSGLVVDAFLPTGSSAFTAGEVLPEIEYIYEWKVFEDFTIDALTILADANDNVTNRDFLNVSQAVGAEEKLTDKITAYIQWHITTPDGADTFRTQQVFEGGFIFPLTKNFQLDVESGIGLNEATPDYFVGTGASIRM